MKGYWIARVDVSDPERYKDYVAANAAAFQKYGGKFLVRGGDFVSKRGTPRARNVVIEFDTYEQAVACFNSPEYQSAFAIHQQCADSDVIIIKGYDPAL